MSSADAAQSKLDALSQARRIAAYWANLGYAVQPVVEPIAVPRHAGMTEMEVMWTVRLPGFDNGKPPRDAWVGRGTSAA